MRKAANLSQSSYRFSTPIRVLIVLVVIVLAVLTALGVLPLASLMGVNLAHLQGTSFQPSLKTMAIVIIYSASQFLLVWLAMHFLHRRKFSSLGFKLSFWKPFLKGSAIGIGMVITEIFIDSMIGGDVSLTWAVPSEVPAISVIGHFLLWMIFLLTLNSLKEELVFRAYPIELFNDHPRANIWVVLSVSMIFAAVHHIIEPFSLSAFLSRFSLALVFAYAYYRWRSIWLIVGIHNGTNFIGFLLGGQWKTGGLFNLHYSSPSSEVIIIVNLTVNLLALALIHFAWKRSSAKEQTASI